MSLTHDSEKSGPLSKVTFYPVKDSSGKNEALIVTIKKINPDTENSIQNSAEPGKTYYSSPSDTKTNTMASRKERSNILKDSTIQDEFVPFSTEMSQKVPSRQGKSATADAKKKRSLSSQTSDPSDTKTNTVVSHLESSSIVEGLVTTRSSEYALPNPKPNLSLYQRGREKHSISETDEKEVRSLASQTSVENRSPSVSVVDPNTISQTPCIKHAAQNISFKAAEIPLEKVSLCTNCSKSMLSYIFLVQDFLDSLAKEICGDTDPKSCMQCLRQEARDNAASRSRNSSVIDAEHHDHTPTKRHSKTSSTRTTRERIRSEHKSESSRQNEVARSGKRSSGRNEIRSDANIYEGDGGVPAPRAELQQKPADQHDRGSNFPHTGHQDQRADSLHSAELSNHNAANSNVTQIPYKDHGRFSTENSPTAPPLQPCGSHNPMPQELNVVSSPEKPSGEPSPAGNNHSCNQGVIFTKPMQRDQPNLNKHESLPAQESAPVVERGESTFPRVEGPLSPFSDEVDGIVSTLSNAEREVYDAARNGAGWESLTEQQERLISSSSDAITSEAFVTMCRNNAEAIGCLVLGTSLLLCRTSRTLCVLVSDSVSTTFRGPLSSVFHVVQYVRSLDSLGTTKLALLEQPELGISFDKLNVWRLVQFNKCVYMNPDTLVLQNCDELFCHEEISAVPDIGWPDCFNSGVFVFVPSLHTFWQLLEFAEAQGSYDGGDQGLLNSYFNSWSDDIAKKLSFIYNLMANVSYTYTPAFIQFGRNVKIVQFHGSFKPWHVKFFSQTGQIAPASPVHPTYVQFVHVWLNIFRISVLRLLSKEIQSYASSQNVICAVELLRFFPLPTESEAEFYLTPPSVRLRLAESRLQKAAKWHTEEIQRRKSAEFSHSSRKTTDNDSNIKSVVISPQELQNAELVEGKKDSPNSEAEISPSRNIDSDSIFSHSGVPDVHPETGDRAAEADISDVRVKADDEDTLPGAEVGNYQRMKAWEQGRMDYQGSESSENVIKRLQFLMSQPK